MYWKAFPFYFLLFSGSNLHRTRSIMLFPHQPSQMVWIGAQRNGLFPNRRPESHKWKYNGFTIGKQQLTSHYNCGWNMAAIQRLLRYLLHALDPISNHGFTPFGSALLLKLAHIFALENRETGSNQYHQVSWLENSVV